METDSYIEVENGGILNVLGTILQKKRNDSKNPLSFLGHFFLHASSLLYQLGEEWVHSKLFSNQCTLNGAVE